MALLKTGKRAGSLLLALALLAGGACEGVKAQQAPIIADTLLQQPVRAAKAMVVTQEAQASRIGLEVLKKGGNAVDAAVAVGFALAVTLPRAGNLGGGGFMLVHLSKGGHDHAIDYRETAPASAKRDMFLDAQGNGGRRFAPRSLHEYQAFDGSGLLSRSASSSPAAGSRPAHAHERPHPQGQGEADRRQEEVIG